MRLLKKPKALVIKGEGVRHHSFGQIRWYFDQLIKYPLTVVDKNRLGRIDLHKYNVLLLPDGWYQLSKSEKEKLADWVRSGGKIIAIGRANQNFIDHPPFALKKYLDDSAKSTSKKAAKEEKMKGRFLDHGGEQRRSISHLVPGAIVRLKNDDSHPLGSGLGDYIYSLRTSNLHYPMSTDAHNVSYIPKGYQSIGFIGHKIGQELNNTVVNGSQDLGRGKVIYLVDNPLFRGFWYNGLILFSNAVFLDW